MKIIAFGEIIWDVYPDEALLGGAPLNFCADLTALNHDVCLYSAVSENDSYGKLSLDALDRYNIKKNFIQKNNAPTGHCDVTLDENKVPCYNIVTDCAYDNLTVGDEVVNAVKAENADLFYFGTLVQRSEMSRRTLKTIVKSCRFADIFCDINLRKNCYDSDSVAYCLEHASFFKLSDGELDELVKMGFLTEGKSNDDSLKELCKKYPNIKYAILTLGKDGSVVYDSVSGTLCHSGKPDDVNVVSTVGAGDCYGASFYHAVSSGMSVKDAVRFATERSNIVVSHKEAIPFWQ